MSENGQTGPTTVHPGLNYNDLASHNLQMNGMQNGLNGLNGMNGMNGLGMLGNSQKYERGEQDYIVVSRPKGIGEMKSNFN